MPIPCNHDQEVLEHAVEAAAADARAEQRAERVEALAQELLQPGGSCYPFEPENFQEALANMGNEEVQMLAEKANDAELSKYEYNPAEYTALRLVLAGDAYARASLEVIKKYWLKTARHLAEKEAPL